MAIIKKFCCCSLKAGSLVLGTLLLLSSLYNAGSGIWDSAFVSQPTDIDLQNQVEDFRSLGVAPTVTIEDLRNFYDILYYIGIVGFMQSLVNIVTTVILLRGVMTANPRQMLPSIVWAPCDCAITVISIIVLCSMIENLMFLVITGFVFMVVELGMTGMFLVCVFSHYQELRDGALGGQSKHTTSAA